MQANRLILLNTATRQVFLEKTEIPLTLREYRLLEVLARNRGIALSRDRLLELAWGYDFAGGTRTVDVHISRLRQKLGLGRSIRTIRGYGYRLDGSGVVLVLRGEDPAAGRFPAGQTGPRPGSPTNGQAGG